MLVLAGLMLLLPSVLTGQQLVSDAFEDGVIDTKWQIQITDPAGMYYEGMNSGNGCLNICNLFPDSVIDISMVEVRLVFPEIVRENFHQNDRDRIGLGLWTFPTWYDQLPENGSRARCTFEVNFSNGDVISNLFYASGNDLVSKVMFNNVEIFSGTSILPTPTTGGGSIELLRLSENTYTFGGASFNSGGMVESVRLCIYGEGVEDQQSFSTQSFTFNYDLDDYFFNNLAFGDLRYEELNNVTVNLKRYNNTSVPFTNAEVKLIDYFNKVLAGPTRVNSSGSVTLSVTPDDTFPHRLIIANLTARGQIDTFEMGDRKSVV